ncbi:MAG: hypothetical protein KBS52_06975 [Clostridiales bacterium]|nr:hypothetical protein [Candidatus Equinaster intestinalis]
MRMFLYYVSHTFVNSIKKLFKSWVVIVLVFAFVFGLAVGIGAATIEDKVADTGEQTAVTEEIEIENEAETDPAVYREKIYPIVEMAVFGVFFAIVFIHLYTSDKNGAAIFNMADVNFLFPSPLRPQAVLFFKTVLQALIITFACTFYLAFQLPNLVLNVGVGLAGAISLIAAFIIAMLFGRTVSVLSYTAAASKIGGKKKILPICIGILSAVIIVFFAVKSAKGLDYFETAKLLFASKYSRLFPVFGWLAGATMSIFDGNYVAAVLYYLALAAAFALLLFIISRIKADFYEDALAGAQKNQEKIEAALEGKQQRAKKRKKEVKETEIGRGKGAGVFFTKGLYVHRRDGVLGPLTKTGITYLLLSLIVCLGTKFAVRLETMAIFGFAILVFSFFKNFETPINEDLQTFWLRLVPENKYKKIFCALAGGTVAAIIDSVPAFVVAAVILGKDFEALLWFLIFASFDAFLSACALAADAIIPDKLHPSIKKMFCIYFRMFMVLPGAFLLIMGLAGGGFTTFALLTVLLNLLLGTGFFFIGAAATNA